ncbi:MAG: hypothetical protein WCO00_00405 [Rhodospirillaceae bacterium]
MALLFMAEDPPDPTVTDPGRTDHCDFCNAVKTPKSAALMGSLLRISPARRN